MLLKPQPENPTWQFLTEERILSQEEFNCRVTMGFHSWDFSVQYKSAFCSQDFRLWKLPSRREWLPKKFSILLPFCYSLLRANIFQQCMWDSHQTSWIFPDEGILCICCEIRCCTIFIKIRLASVVESHISNHASVSNRQWLFFFLCELLLWELGVYFHWAYERELSFYKLLKPKSI